MVDRLFSDVRLAELYDACCPATLRGDFGFHLKRVMAARSVLDVGCGTGALLHLARHAGHTGRLCGLDPAAAMLDQARGRTDAEWILGDLGSVRFDQEFDLVVMTGHVFQVFLTDDELRAALGAVCAALTEEGRFAFETRNPTAREWLRWTPDNVVEVTDPGGGTVLWWHEVHTVDGEFVSFTNNYAAPRWDRPQVSHSTLRFLDAEAVGSFLAEAGLAVTEQYGDWDESPLTNASPEIILIAGRTRKGVAPPRTGRP